MTATTIPEAKADAEKVIYGLIVTELASSYWPQSEIAAKLGVSNVWLCRWIDKNRAALKDDKKVCSNRKRDWQWRGK